MSSRSGKGQEPRKSISASQIAVSSFIIGYVLKDESGPCSKQHLASSIDVCTKGHNVFILYLLDVLLNSLQNVLLGDVGI